MNLELLNALLTAGLIAFCVIFAIRAWHRLEAIARSVEEIVEQSAGAVSNIVLFRRPGVPRSAAIVTDDELDQAYRCRLRGKGEA